MTSAVRASARAAATASRTPTAPRTPTASRTPTAPRTNMAPRMRIDWTRCDGHGLCAALLPGAIARDEWGYPVVDDLALAAVPAAALNRAVTACPALALRRTDA